MNELSGEIKVIASKLNLHVEYVRGQSDISTYSNVIESCFLWKYTRPFFGSTLLVKLSGCHSKTVI